MRQPCNIAVGDLNEDGLTDFIFFVDNLSDVNNEFGWRHAAVYLCLSKEIDVDCQPISGLENLYFSVAGDVVGNGVTQIMGIQITHDAAGIEHQNPQVCQVFSASVSAILTLPLFSVSLSRSH